MEKSFKKIQEGYSKFRQKYTQGAHSVMKHLAISGQHPEIMVVTCCDSRVDPALILQCDPGDLFVLRNVANIIPPYEKSLAHDGTKAALEYGISFLNVKHLIILGHSYCGGIDALLNNEKKQKNDFISEWVSLIKSDKTMTLDNDDYAKQALSLSRQHCFTYPWIKSKIDQHKLTIHLWFFDIEKGQIYAYSEENKEYLAFD